jgi:fructosamine-3-kinase
MRTDTAAAEQWLEASGRGRVTARRALAGGDTCAAWELLLASGERLFLKARAGAPAQMFAAEACGLCELARSRSVRVPAVIHAAPGFLLLEYIDPGSADASFWPALGRALARLHDAPAPSFGFLMDNWCGATPQPNPRVQDGHAFFAEHRLLYQARRAFAAGLLAAPDLGMVERLAARLRELVPAQSPALLHGDLWHGNVFASAAREPVLIDPAAHWGWPEADIAMTRLFGGFAADFYAAYREARPLAPGWEQRLPLYNLYHLLNHLNLFGRAWLGRVREVLERYA